MRLPFNLAKSMCFFCQRIGGLTDFSPTHKPL